MCHIRWWGKFSGHSLSLLDVSHTNNIKKKDISTKKGVCSQGEKIDINVVSMQFLQKVIFKQFGFVFIG